MADLGSLKYEVEADTSKLNKAIDNAKATVVELSKKLGDLEAAERAGVISQKELADSTKVLQSAMKSATEEITMGAAGMTKAAYQAKQVAAATNAAAKASKGATMATQELGRGFEDFLVTGGSFRSIINNANQGLANFAMQSGMSAGKLLGLSMGITAAGMALDYLVNHWEDFKRAVGLDTTPDILSNRLTTLREKIKELEKKDVKIAIDVIQLEDARKEVERIEKALAAVNKLKTQKNEPQTLAEHAVESAFKETPGGPAAATAKLQEQFIEEKFATDTEATKARQRIHETQQEIPRYRQLEKEGTFGAGQKLRDLVAEQLELNNILKARRKFLAEDKESPVAGAAGSLLTAAYEEAAKGPQFDKGDKNGKNRKQILGPQQRKLVARIARFNQQLADQIERDLLNAAGGVGPQREIEAQGLANTSKGKEARRLELAEQAKQRKQGETLGRYELETTRGREMGAAHKKNTLDDVMKDIAAGSTSEAAMAKASAELAQKLNKIIDPAYVPEVVMDLMDDMAVDLEKRLSKANPDESLSLKEAAQKSIEESPEAKQAAAAQKRAEAATARHEREIKRATHKQAKPLVSMYDSALIPALQSAMFQGASKEDLQKQVEARLRRMQPGKAKEAYAEAAGELVDRAWAGLTENLAKAAMGVGGRAGAGHGAHAGGRLHALGIGGGGAGLGMSGAIGIGAGFGFPGIMPGADVDMFGVGYMAGPQRRAGQSARDRVARQNRAYEARGKLGTAKADPFAGTSLEGFNPAGESIADEWARKAKDEQRREAIQPMINAAHAQGVEIMEARRDAIQPMIDAATAKDKDRFDAGRKAIGDMSLSPTGNKAVSNAMSRAFMGVGGAMGFPGGASGAAAGVSATNDVASVISKGNEQVIKLLTDIKNKPSIGVLA